MTKETHIRTLLLLGSISALSLSGCASQAERLAAVGKEPELTQIVNPEAAPGYKPVSLPMPVPEHVQRQKNSLWAANRQTFFKDQRARTVGDILTVTIEISDKAQLKNETSRTRGSSEKADATSLLGVETKLADVWPEAIDPTSLIDMGADSSHKGTGEVKRKEDIDLKLAALVTQILPNGNMVIQGRQEVRVNFEKRILELAGVIRPEDISIDNSVPYDKIAEARISYGGKGQITDVQQPRYGQQVYDVLFPF